MMQATFFCHECGAANQPHSTHCFACQTRLLAIVTPTTFKEVALGNGPVALQLDVQQSGAPTAQTIEEEIAEERSGPLPRGHILAGRYKIVEQVGHGGFGIVYKARDRRRFYRLVAVKQINLDQLSAREIIQATDSYNREISMHPLLRHRNLPRFYNHFTDTSHWYLVMDYIKGETLDDSLKKVSGGKLPLKDVLNIGIEISGVLDYLHTKHGIIFRDVKPGNIMRTRRGRLYLIDFGIARRYVRGKRKDTMPLGSPDYAAPEQYGTGQSSEQTDIYGLGATLRALLTGSPSQMATTGITSSVSVTTHDLSVRDQSTTPGMEVSDQMSIPSDLRALLDHMQAWDAEQRPESMQVVQRALYRLRGGVPRGLVLCGRTFFVGILLGMLPALLHLAFYPIQYYQFMYCVAPLIMLGELMLAMRFVKMRQRRILGWAMFSGFAMGLLILTAFYLI